MPDVAPYIFNCAGRLKTLQKLEGYCSIPAIYEDTVYLLKCFFLKKSNFTHIQNK